MRCLIRSLRVTLVPAVSAAIVVGGCETREPTEPTVSDVQLKPAGGGPGPKVDSTDPPFAEQDTTLDVRVLGSGFDQGSNVTFLLDGESVPTVQTNSVAFVSNKELRANITIALEAVPDFYDVEVLTSRGKRGIGADLFEVVLKGSLPCGGDESCGINAERPLQVSIDDTKTGVTSDGQGVYVHDVDRVHAVIRLNGNMQFDAALLNGKSAEPIRQVNVEVVKNGAPLVTKQLVDAQFNSLTPPLLDLPVGVPQDIEIGFNWTSGDIMFTVRYGFACDITEKVPGGIATITRTATDTWAIETPDTEVAVWCEIGQKGKTKGVKRIDGVAAPFGMTLQLLPEP